jgi:DNA-binding GntR family transcriptional regulator
MMSIMRSGDGLNLRPQAGGGPVDWFWPSGLRSLRNQVADALREAILRGDFAPGDRLLENALSEQMQISRGPLREALRELEREGLAKSFPYRGTVVSAISRESIVEVLMPVRVVLETCGFEHARSRIDDKGHADLARLIEDMLKAADDLDVRRVVETDLAFHALVMRIGGQEESIRLWHSIEPRIRGFFYTTTPPAHESLRLAASQHLELAERLKSGTKRQLKEAVRIHIENVPGFTADPPAGS